MMNQRVRGAAPMTVRYPLYGTMGTQDVQYAPRRVYSPEEIVRCRRHIRLLVVHCSATRSVDRYTPEALVRDHIAQGYRGAGYHYYITRDGNLYSLRPIEEVGAHARGYNLYSIGVCYEGGLDADFEPSDTRTPAQMQTLVQLHARLLELWPDLYTVGHRDLSPDRDRNGVITSDEWIKVCPCFDAKVMNKCRKL